MNLFRITPQTSTGKHLVVLDVNEAIHCMVLSLDQIEDLETKMTDIIKQLQDYRMKQNIEL